MSNQYNVIIGSLNSLIKLAYSQNWFGVLMGGLPTRSKSEISKITHGAKTPERKLPVTLFTEHCRLKYWLKSWKKSSHITTCCQALLRPAKQNHSLIFGQLRYYTCTIVLAKIEGLVSYIHVYVCVDGWPDILLFEY